jgi:osmotically inducible protein OsmC
MKRTAQAEWHGPVESGEGRLALGSGTFEGPYTFAGRGDGSGTNPEELIGAAHAGCFTMALSSRLTKAGHAPVALHTDAVVHLSATPAGFRIPRIELTTRGTVPGLDQAGFAELAADAKQNCPVSVALAGVEITLDAQLVEETAPAPS